VGKLRLVLLEGPSKRSTLETPAWHGRTDQNKRIVFPVNDNLSCISHDDILSGTVLPSSMGRQDGSVSTLSNGDYCVVRVTEAKGHTLRGDLICRTTLKRFSEDEDKLNQALLRDLRSEVVPTICQPIKAIPFEEVGTC